MNNTKTSRSSSRPKIAGKRRKSGQKFILKIAILALLFLSFCPIRSSAKNSSFRIKYSGTVVATAYNSEEGQTDSTPWTTASGSRCRDGVIASNFLPFGTKVIIEGFDNKVFVVEDRMNKRYAKRIDIWFRDHHRAVKFGVQKIKYHVLKAA